MSDLVSSGFFWGALLAGHHGDLGAAICLEMLALYVTLEAA